MGFRLAKVQALHLKNADEVRKQATLLKGFGGTESERDDKVARKRKIKDKILGSEATPFRWAIGTVKETGLKRRVNGQHSSEVFLEMTPEEWRRVVFPVVVIWEEYDCDALQDLPSLFEQFDPQWSNRDSKDIIGAHLGIHDALRSAINRHVALVAATGIVWHRNAVEGLKIAKDAKYLVVHESAVHDFLTYCGSFLQKGKTEEMHAAAVIAAIYRTATDDEARAFWKRVASGKAPLDADTIEYKLAEFLELCRDRQAEWPRVVSKTFRVGSTSPTDLDIFATCLRAFRSWKKGTRVADVFTPSKGRKAAQIATDFEESVQAA